MGIRLKYLVACCSFILPMLTTFCQGPADRNVILPGRVRCLNNGIVNSTRGAQNLVVVPGFLPDGSVPTDTEPRPGFFDINTLRDFNDLRDRKLLVYVVAKCGIFPFTFFVSPDQLDPNQPDTARNIYLRRQQIKLPKDCRITEFDLLKSAKILDSVKKVEVEEWSTKDNVAAASPALLNILLFLAGAAAAPAVDSVAVNRYPVENAGPTKMSFGNFLMNSFAGITSNQGFNLAPSRNMGEALFWNTSALLTPNRLATRVAHLNTFTNLRSHFKLNSTFLFSHRFAIGVGAILNGQSEERQVYFKGDTINQKFNGQEYALFVGAAYKIHKLQFGVNVKWLGQKFTTPLEIIERLEYSGGDVVSREIDLVKKKVRNSNFDIDFSFTYPILPNLILGGSVQNIANTRFVNQSYLPLETPQKVGLRTAGIGLNYLYKRWQLGNEWVVWQGKVYTNVGLNVVPFNNAQFTIGWSSWNDIKSIGFQYGRFKIQYIDYNDVMVNSSNVKRTTGYLLKKPCLFASSFIPLGKR